MMKYDVTEKRDYLDYNKEVDQYWSWPFARGETMDFNHYPSWREIQYSSVHDKGNIYHSNYEVVMTQIKEKGWTNGKEYIANCTHHGLNYLRIDATNPEVMEYADKIASRLENYAILDEYHYSELIWEHRYVEIASCPECNDPIYLITSEGESLCVKSTFDGGDISYELNERECEAMKDYSYVCKDPECKRKGIIAPATWNHYREPWGGELV